jgi:hypothetical protein
MVCLTIPIADFEYIVMACSTRRASTLADLMFIDHAFDEYVSSKISLNRSLPDRRNRHHFLDPENRI